MFYRYLESYEILLDKSNTPNSNGQITIHCPFHQDQNPSCSINLETGPFNCFGCSAQGSFEKFCIQLLKAWEKKDTNWAALVEKAKILAELNTYPPKIFGFYKSPRTGLAYEIGKVLSVNNGIKVSLNSFWKWETFFSDTPNLSSDKSRRSFANKCVRWARGKQSEGMGVNVEDYEADLLAILERCQARLEAIKEAPTQKNAVEALTEEELAIGLKFLKSKDMFDELSEDLKRLGLVGEELNARMLYLACTSRKLDSPISIIFKGQSSSGKSYTVSKVLSLIPPEDVRTYSYMSSKAIGYVDREYFKHKILAIFERAGSEASDYSIRNLQSENIFRIATTCKDPKTGKFKTWEVEVIGPISYIETTTQEAVHLENETRQFSLYTDESPEQTERILENQRKMCDPDQALSEGEHKGVVRKHIAAQALLKPCKVFIPYARHLKFPSNRTRSRRDFVRLLSLIKAVTLLHQEHREKIEKKGEPFLVATPQDYELAFELIKKIIIESYSEIPPKSRKLLSICRKFDGNFTRKELQEECRWSLDDVRKYVGHLVRKGYLEVITGDQGQRYWYKVSDEHKEDEFHQLLSPQQLLEEINSNKQKVIKLVSKISKDLSGKTCELKKSIKVRVRK